MSDGTRFWDYATWARVRLYAACKTSTLLLICVAGCTEPMQIDKFAASQPAFDPLIYWTGHTHSWGVVETPAGAPSETVTTDCIGVPEGTNGLRMHQTLIEGDGTVKHREWYLRRLAPGRFEATANDMVGKAEGTAVGRVFHWQWIWAVKPGNNLFNVTMSQWMYAMPDGAMLNRTVVSKLGVTVAEVSEQFSRVTD